MGRVKKKLKIQGETQSQRDHPFSIDVKGGEFVSKRRVTYKGRIADTRRVAYRGDNYKVVEYLTKGFP